MRVVAIEVGRHVRVTGHPHVPLAPQAPCHLVLLLPLHPPVAEPNLDLLLRHAQRVSDLYSSSPRQISDEVLILEILNLSLMPINLLKWNSFSSSRVWNRV